MSYKKFLVKYLIITLAVVGILIGLNCYIDIYGLFRGKKDRNVYINERTTKYLFSFRYIPENFEGVIFGPSLSANLNPEEIRDYKIYNASMMGVNISELNFLVDNIIKKGHLKFAILCLNPYITKDHGKKDPTIDPKEYYGALGSTNLLRTYLLYFVRKYNLTPKRYSPYTFNTLGYDNFGLEMHNLSVKDSIEKRLAVREPDSTYIDPIAYKELGETLQKLRDHHIKVFGYYTPVPYKLYQMNRVDYLAYKKRIDSLFHSDDVLLDLNDEQYREFTDDYSIFLDHGHLAAKGQTFVLRVLDSALNKNLR